MSMGASGNHDLYWGERLQDWLDGELDPAEMAAFKAHLAGCSDCQMQLEDLEQLDESLCAAFPSIALDETFDRDVLAQLRVIDETRRAAARKRAEQELQDNLHALSRGWRSSLTFVMSGVVAAIALAFALTGWFEDAGITRTIVSKSANELGSIADMVPLMLTVLIGAGVGWLVSWWLSAVAE